MIRLTAMPANNLIRKMVGLIGKQKPEPLLIKTRFGIHTLGLKFPIDVIVLNKKNTVMTLKKSLKPNRFFLWNPIYNTIIELPRGTIEKESIKINSAIDINLTK